MSLSDLVYDHNPFVLVLCGKEDMVETVFGTLCVDSTDPFSNCFETAIAHGTPLSDDEQCALQVPQGPGTGDRSYLLGGTGRPVIRTTGMGTDRCSVVGTGGGAGSLNSSPVC